MINIPKIIKPQHPPQKSSKTLCFRSLEVSNHDRPLMTSCHSQALAPWQYLGSPLSISWNDFNNKKMERRWKGTVPLTGNWKSTKGKSYTVWFLNHLRPGQPTKPRSILWKLTKPWIGSSYRAILAAGVVTSTNGLLVFPVGGLTIPAISRKEEHHLWLCMNRPRIGLTCNLAA